MKLLKIAAIATIITSIIILSCAVAFSAKAEEYGEFYPRLTVVIGSTRIESNLWVVSCKDKNNNIWSFFDKEGTWKNGDIANLLMWNNGEIKQHEIIEVYWEGYVNDINDFFQMEGWH